MDRACEFCGRTDTMIGKRLNAKFCNDTCRQAAHRRKEGAKKRRVNFVRVRVSRLEHAIGLSRQIGMTGEQALRSFAKNANIPLYEDRINEVYDKYYKQKD